MKHFDANPDAAMSFLVSQRTHIEQAIYEIRYPGVTYDQVIPVDSSAPEWAPIVAVQSADIRGELQFGGPNSNDDNRADVAYGLGTHPIQTGRLGYGYSLEEIQQAMLMGRDLSTDKARSTMRVFEQGLNKLAYLGNDSAGYEGLFTNSAVPASDPGTTIESLAAAATDVAGAQALVQFFQDKLNQVYIQQSRTTFAPTHIIIPPAQRGILASTILPFGGAMTILNYLEANLDVGGGRVQIISEISLEGIGAGGDDRMVIYNRDLEVAKFHLPMGPRFLDPYRDSGTSWFIPGLVRTGGTEIRVPQAMAYIDGV